MIARSAVIERAKAVILRLTSRSPRVRWGLASLTGRQAFQSVCATRDEKELDDLGAADAQRIAPLLIVTSKVLDIGCGVGRVEKFLFPFCLSIDAVDVSDRMLAVAKNRLEGVQNVHFTRTDAKNLRAFQDETFDLCFSFHCLQHMEKENAWLVLGEIFRVLKKGGVAKLHFPSFTSDTYFSLFKDEKHWSDNSRVRGYTIPELEKMATAVGFQLGRSERLCLNPMVKPVEPDRDILLTLRK
jgi:SAM-dependent methyltransferase